MTETVEGFAVVLDGKPLRTPSGNPYNLQAGVIAKAIAEEWNAVGETIKPACMPLTQYVATALDVVPQKRAEIVRQVMAYAETDLLCHRAEEPSDLVKWQQEVWQPLLDWAAERFGAKLAVTHGIQPVRQDSTSIKALGRIVEAQGDLKLALLQSATALSGSLLIGLALLEGRLDAKAAFTAAELEASHQIEKWGLDNEARMRRDALLDDLQAIERLARMLA